MGISITLNGSTLALRGGTNDDVITVSRASSGAIVVAITERPPGSESLTHIFKNVPITGIVAYGGDGNDILSNLTDIPCTLYGGDGNDYIIGSSGTTFSTVAAAPMSSVAARVMIHLREDRATITFLATPVTIV